MCSRLLAPANCVVIILVAVWFVNTFLCNICKKYDWIFRAKGQRIVDFGAHRRYNEYKDESEFDKLLCTAQSLPLMREVAKIFDF